MDTGEHTLNKPCSAHKGHAHKHGVNCGHMAIKYEDHIDYEHDGQLHKLHGDHVDEYDGGKAHVSPK